MSLSVMKGVPYTEKRLVSWLNEDGGVVVQTKRDEVRCVAIVGYDGKVTYTSASGKPLYNISDAFSNIFIALAEEYNIHRFDMGVCVNDSFDLTRRVVRSSSKAYDCRGRKDYIITEKLPGQPRRTVYEGPLVMQFWLYDLPDLTIPYEERRALMAELVRYVGNSVFTPETEVVHTTVDVNNIYDMVTDLGFEGVMLKRLNFQYKEGRTTDWMKMKPEEEVDVEIIGYTPGKDSFEGMVGSLIGRAEDGSEVSFSGFTLALRRELTDNFEAYLGRWAEVRYMQRDSQDGYRHPRFYRWHADK